jgi:phosphoribosylanthranilate isomerase
MSLKTFVKVSGVNNLSDARYCAGMGVNVLGFNLDPLSHAYVPPEKFNAIREWISGVSLAAEFSLSPAQAIEQQLKNFSPIDYLQIENPFDLSGVMHLDIPLILPVAVEKLNKLESIGAYMEEYQEIVRYFLLVSSRAGSQSPSFEDILKLAEKYPILLEYGLDAENVISLIEHTHLAGIALRGGDEIRPGYKHFDELADILEAIEAEE